VLRLEAAVDNPDSVPLPFGLGYHPYFLLPASGSVPIEAPARQSWELIETLPTGRRLPVEGRCDLRLPRASESLQLDDLLTDLPASAGPMRDSGAVGDLRLSCSPDFEHQVAFTPPHRQAICLEPYTCITDAINLEREGIDAGWRVLAAGGRWEAAVQMGVGR
jgi:aldose 1-epimerase